MQHFQTVMRVKITSDGCQGSPSEVMYLEHVDVSLSLIYPRRGDLEIDITSPSGENIDELRQVSINLPAQKVNLLRESIPPASYHSNFISTCNTDIECSDFY